jgi:hypothetical protein
VQASAKSRAKSRQCKRTLKSFTTLDSDRFANDEDNPGSSGCLDQRPLVSALSNFYSSSLTKRPVSYSVSPFRPYSG